LSRTPLVSCDLFPHPGIHACFFPVRTGREAFPIRPDSISFVSQNRRALHPLSSLLFPESIFFSFSLFPGGEASLLARRTRDAPFDLKQISFLFSYRPACAKSLSPVFRDPSGVSLSPPGSSPLRPLPSFLFFGDSAFLSSISPAGSRLFSEGIPILSPSPFLPVL